MDEIRQFLETVRDSGVVTGSFRGFLHVAIGRTVSKPNGTIVSTGLTWRELAGLLKLLRFDRDLVREYGADPDALAPRDRERFWYSAISQARVDSREASAEADALIGRLKDLGYLVGPPPAGSGRPTPPPAKARPERPAEPKAQEDKPTKRKKKG